jgi:hypothetical protein
VVAERVGWAVLSVHDMRGRFCAKGFDWDPVREDDDGVEVAVLQPVFVDGLFPATDFGDSAAQAQAEVNAIVDEAAS